MSVTAKTYYLYQNQKELNSTGVHEVRIDHSDLYTVHLFKEYGWKIAGEIKSTLDLSDILAGMTAKKEEALRDAENTLDIIHRYISEWSKRDEARRIG